MISILESWLRHTYLTLRYELRSWEVRVCAILGVAFTGILVLVTPTLTALATGYLLFTMLLVMLIDSRHFIIPDVLSLPAIPAGILAACSAFPGSTEAILLDQVLAACVAGASLYAIRAIYGGVRGVEGLGLGDVKLAAAAGAWVGLEALPMTSLLATCAALTTILISNSIRGANSAGLKTAIPFGSFIAPAIVVMWSFRILTG